jgi:NarL family two-component system response regulator LiaR
MANKIRIMIVDDHAVVRQGLRTMLEPKGEYEVVGEATNGIELIQLCRTLQPDLIILDLIMPELGGIEAIQQIKKCSSKSKILVLTSFSEEGKVIAALKAGANAYVLKESSPEELLHAIQAVVKGETWIYPNLAKKALEQLIHPTQTSTEEIELTRKELEVIKLIAKGKTNSQIAQDLCVSESTVRFHLSNIFSKLDLKNRTQVALFALREGLTTLEEE